MQSVAEMGRMFRSWIREYGPRKGIERINEALGIPNDVANRMGREQRMHGVVEAHEFHQAAKTRLRDVPTQLQGRRVMEAWGDENDAEAVRPSRRVLGNIPLAPLAQGMMGDNCWGVYDRFVRESLGGGRTPESYLNIGRVTEAIDPVDPSAFAHTTGQILVTLVQQQYDAPDFISDKFMETYDDPTPVNLGVHIVPRTSRTLQGPSLVQPGMEYPSTKIVEDWYSLPAIQKWGEIEPVTIEAMMQDRTGQVADQASQLGWRAGYDLEEQRLNVILGLTNNYVWKNTGFNTYLSNGTNWINKITGQVLTGATFQVLNNLEQLFKQILDPYTSKNIRINPTKLLCMPESLYDIKNMLHATGVWVGPWAQNGINRVGTAPNPLDVQYDFYASPIARTLLINSGVSAANVLNYMYLTDPTKAFKYRQVLPWAVVAAPPGNWAEFNQDVGLLVKVRRMGTPGVSDARFTGLSINA